MIILSKIIVPSVVYVVVDTVDDMDIVLNVIEVLIDVDNVVVIDVE